MFLVPKKQKQAAKNLSKKIDDQKPADPKYTKFLDYLDARQQYVPVEKPKHLYTIEFRKAMYTEELFEMYVRYEKAVHKKDRDEEQLKRFVCSSPIFDPENEDDAPAI